MTAVNPSMPRFALLALLPLLACGCATTKAYRHKDQTVTVARRASIFKPSPVSYWMVGAKPGTLTNAEDLKIFRKARMKSDGAAPIKCAGFVDTTRHSRIEVRLAEKRGGQLEQAWVNGTHKLIDENAPKPFYHWLIP